MKYRLDAINDGENLAGFPNMSQGRLLVKITTTTVAIHHHLYGIQHGYILDWFKLSPVQCCGCSDAEGR